MWAWRKRHALRGDSSWHRRAELYWCSAREENQEVGGIRTMKAGKWRNVRGLKVTDWRERDRQILIWFSVRVWKWIKIGKVLIGDLRFLFCILRLYWITNHVPVNLSYQRNVKFSVKQRGFRKWMFSRVDLCLHAQIWQFGVRISAAHALSLLVELLNVFTSAWITPCYRN